MRRGDHPGVRAACQGYGLGKDYNIALGALTRLMPRVHYPAVEEEIRKNFPASIVSINLDAYKMDYDIIDEDLRKLGYQTGFGEHSRF